MIWEDYSIENPELADQYLEEREDFVFDDEEAVSNTSSMAGCYVFETTRRNYGGEYRWVGEHIEKGKKKVIVLL